MATGLRTRVVAGLLAVLVFAGIALKIRPGFVPKLRPIFTPMESCVPPILSVEERPEAALYVARPPHRPAIPVKEIPEPPLPVDHSRIAGRVLHAVRDPAAAAWVIQSYAGQSWMDEQHLNVFVEATGLLREIDDFADGHVVQHPTVLHGGDPVRAFVAFHLSPYGRFDLDAEQELWTFELPAGPLEPVTNGYGIDASPDHALATYWRSDDRGFHVLHLWDVASSTRLPILSMWESDPGSGMTFEVHWTDDSRALRIVGDCGGFEAERDPDAWTELDLVYLVATGELVTLR